MAGLITDCHVFIIWALKKKEQKTKQPQNPIILHIAFYILKSTVQKVLK